MRERGSRELVLIELASAVLKTGLTPSASGSAYIELEPPPTVSANTLLSHVSCLKLTCTVHGPRPLPRSAPFSSQLQLSTRVKFAPFAARERKGYVPDASERDLGAHLETALRGVLIGERWPKSGVDVVVTVLEGEEDRPLKEFGAKDQRPIGGLAMMSVLSGCITVASAALADAGIDSVDLVTGGVAAVVQRHTHLPHIVLDPAPSDDDEIIAACVVAYLHSRDEISELWAKGSLSSTTKAASSVNFEPLVDHAVQAAVSARLVLIDALKEGTEAKMQAGNISEAKEA